MTMPAAKAPAGNGVGELPSPRCDRPGLRRSPALWRALALASRPSTQLEMSCDVRHRRTQVVACPGDELAPGIEQRLEIGRHGVEGLAEVFQLWRICRQAWLQTNGATARAAELQKT